MLPTCEKCIESDVANCEWVQCGQNALLSQEGNFTIFTLAENTTFLLLTENEAIASELIASQKQLVWFNVSALYVFIVGDESLATLSRVSIRYG